MFLYPKTEKIIRLREFACLSRRALSQKAGLPDNALLRIENGKTKKINHLRAREIARVLGCEVEDICSLPERNA